jgi:tetratricopeptide (TPR) repeat protein
MAVAAFASASAPLARSAELNPFFPRRVPDLTPIVRHVEGQIAQGCTAGVAGQIPLADRFDQRHPQPQPQPPALFRAGAAISLANPGYAQARAWLEPLLADTEPRVAYGAYALLLSHGARLLAAGNGAAAAAMAQDLDTARRLADTAKVSPADLELWSALLAGRAGSSRRALDHVEAALQADPSFYNARLLKLELLLNLGRSDGGASSACRVYMRDVLASAIALFDLDTCPRHAVLLLNWLRARYGLEPDFVAGDLLRAYVAVLLGNARAYEVAVRTLREQGGAPCRDAALAEILPLHQLLEQR